MSKLPPDHATRRRALELADEIARALDAQPEAAARRECLAGALEPLLALQGVTSALSGAVTPEQVGQAVAEHGARALGGTGGVVYALDPGGSMLRVIGTWGYEPTSSTPSGRCRWRARLPVTDAARDRRTIVGDHAELVRAYPELAGVAGAGQSLCAVPLVAGDEVLGAAGVSNSRGVHAPPSASCWRRSRARAARRSSAPGCSAASSAPTTACTACRPRRPRSRGR